MNITAVGTFNLNGQTATVSCAAITASSIVLLTYQDTNWAFYGTLGVSNRTAGVSFVVSSTKASTGKVGYVVVEP